MTPEEIRNKTVDRTHANVAMLREIAAQLAELNEKFSDFFASCVNGIHITEEDDEIIRLEKIDQGEK